jgi:hypothetical protein
MGIFRLAAPAAGAASFFSSLQEANNTRLKIMAGLINDCNLMLLLVKVG